MKFSSKPNIISTKFIPIAPPLTRLPIFSLHTYRTDPGTRHPLQHFFPSSISYAESPYSCDSHSHVYTFPHIPISRSMSVIPSVRYMVFMSNLLLWVWRQLSSLCSFSSRFFFFTGIILTVSAYVGPNGGISGWVQMACFMDIT